MMKIKSVLGDVEVENDMCVLPHEHICCYSEYINMMVGKVYIDKEELIKRAINELAFLKSKYGLGVFVDCTPVNIGRDIELLKKISLETKVHIICSTGFYYTYDRFLDNTDVDILAEHIVYDAKNINAGIIKAAVESEDIIDFNIKLLRAAAKAQLKLNLPICLHTNAKNKNALEALDILLNDGIKPESITVAHLSDTNNIEYIKSIAKLNCYVGLDRLYGDTSNEYIEEKILAINQLCDAGFADKILLSHDELVFNGFQANPKIKDKVRYNYLFDYIISKIDDDTANQIIKMNPFRMLNCGKV